MAKKTPANANEFIEQQLDERLTALEEDFSADGFVFHGGLLFA